MLESVLVLLYFDRLAMRLTILSFDNTNVLPYDRLTIPLFSYMIVWQCQFLIT